MHLDVPLDGGDEVADVNGQLEIPGIPEVVEDGDGAFRRSGWIAA